MSFGCRQAQLFLLQSVQTTDYLVSRPALQRTQPPVQWVPGVRSAAVKWPESEADTSPPSSVDGKKLGATSLLPHIASSRSQGQSVTVAGKINHGV